MVSQLRVTNFGLIDDISIEFCDSLNVFTGETGAGKSILIDALRFVLGERMNASHVRNTDAPCMVEAVFDLPESFFKENDILDEYIDDEDSTVIIRRTYSEGKNRIKINGSRVTVAQLKVIGDHLIDFHGPNDHQMLLSSDSHISILDRLSGIGGIMAEYEGVYSEYRSLNKKLKDLKELSEGRDRELDLLSHQIRELEQVPLDPGKYEEIINEQSRVDNLEKIFDNVKSVMDLFDNESGGINGLVSEAFGPLERLSEADEGAKNMLQILESIQINCTELGGLLTDYFSGLSFDPERIEEINRLTGIYFELLRKYGPDISDLNVFYKKIKEKYDLLVDIEHSNSDVSGKIDSLEKKLSKIALKITAKRKKTAGALKKTIEKELKELGITHVEFECMIKRSDLGKYGSDEVVFYISPNAGEPLKPLSEIVSSGEAARLMLALKKALTDVDPIPVLIFDEIDSQIGGRLGTITGEKLSELAVNRQVILITHLPQIASYGDCHLKVVKAVSDGRTSTKVDNLLSDQRVKELAKMMSGEKETEISIKHAKDMLSKASRMQSA